MKNLVIMAVASIGLFSCTQNEKSAPDKISIQTDTLNTPKIVKNKRLLSNIDSEYMDTEYVYTDSVGKRLRIQNSLPKGGLKYTAPSGRDYVYAVFWTRIINDGTDPLELSIHFPADSLEISSSADTYFNLVLISDTTALYKKDMSNIGSSNLGIPLDSDLHKFNYGLENLDSILDSRIHNQSSLLRTINPNQSCSFYVVTLFNKGVNGRIRTGFNRKEQKLFYRVNNEKIQCGQLAFRNRQ